MKILFGHPGGAPHSHNAALAHFEAGRLEAFCVPWMPTPNELALVNKLPGLGNWSARLQRRSFPPLLDAPKIEGRLSEWIRMAKRVAFGDRISSEALAYEANDWLMNTMARECRRPSVTAVHSYEDCSLYQFQAAKKMGKACIYDMPIGYYPAWEQTQERLAVEFGDWLPEGGLSSRRYVRPAQKKAEMELADLVLGPCSFVAQTISNFVDKPFALAPYGVNADFWTPSHEEDHQHRPFRFISVGHISVRKGTPVLLEAWKQACLDDAELLLVGPWELAKSIRANLPSNVRHIAPCSALDLRNYYRSSDVFVFPSFFEGFGLVLLEAMACGLPILATERTAAPDFVTADTGLIVPAGDHDAWAEALRSVVENRERWISMRDAARKVAIENDWKHYRRALSAGIDRFLS